MSKKISTIINELLNRQIYGAITRIEFLRASILELYYFTVMNCQALELVGNIK